MSKSRDESVEAIRSSIEDQVHAMWAEKFPMALEQWSAFAGEPAQVTYRTEQGRVEDLLEGVLEAHGYDEDQSWTDRFALLLWAEQSLLSFAEYEAVVSR